MSGWYDYFTSKVNSVVETATDTFNSVNEYAHQAYDYVSETADKIQKTASSAINYTANIANKASALTKEAINIGQSILEETVLESAELLTKGKFSKLFDKYIRYSGIETACKFISKKIRGKLNIAGIISDAIAVFETTYRTTEWVCQKTGVTDSCARFIGWLMKNKLMSLDTVNNVLDTSDKIAVAGKETQHFIDDKLDLVSYATDFVGDKVGTTLLDQQSLVKRKNFQAFHKKWDQFSNSLTSR